MARLSTRKFVAVVSAISPPTLKSSILSVCSLPKSSLVQSMRSLALSSFLLYCCGLQVAAACQSCLVKLLENRRRSISIFKRRHHDNVYRHEAMMITGAVDSTLRRAFLANGVDATILNFLLVRRLLLEIADEAEAGLGPVGDDREKELIDIIGGDSTEQSANSKDESSGESSEITSQSMIIAIGVSCVTSRICPFLQQRHLNNYNHRFKFYK